ncbi:MAG TPA: OsmC family protein [Candidatus Limnocylindria bacterium]|nr:OsmC family protein [Candidatus Limnocylindria bacterium]
MTDRVTVIRRRPAAPPVYLLEVEAKRGDRTRVTGALWDGVLNASPEDVTDGPSPVEALLAGVAGCFVRNLRWVADGAHVELDRIRLRLAAERDDDPPAISQVRVEVDVDTGAPAARVAGIVERALKSGTITRTVARAADLEFVLRINGQETPVRLPEWRLGSAG